MEEWRDVVGFEGLYQVSDLGRIKSLRRVIHRVRPAGAYKVVWPEKILKTSTTCDGYLRVPISKDGVRFTVALHRVVAIAFLPNPNNLPEVDHLNGVRTDCSARNLDWVTGLENKRRAVERGTSPAGERNGRAKLTQEIAEQIRAAWPATPQRQLAARFGVSKAAVYFVLKGKTWA